MRIRSICVVILLISLGFSAYATSQDMLKYFSEDSFLIVKLEFQKLLSILPPEEREAIAGDSFKNLGFDISSKIQTLMLGSEFSSDMASDENFLGVFRADVSMDVILAAAKKSGGEIKEESIGGLKCYSGIIEEDGEEDEYYDEEDEYYDEEDEYEEEELVEYIDEVEIFFSNFESGMFVFGSRANIEKFQAIRSGEFGNAGSNTTLKTLLSQANPDAFLTAVGVFSPTAKKVMADEAPPLAEIDAFSAVVFDGGESINYDVEAVLSSPEAAQNLKDLVDQGIKAFGAMDQTGTLKELFDNLVVQVSGNKFMINGKINKSFIADLSKQFFGQEE